jgi:hypothetical protein
VARHTITTRAMGNIFTCAAQPLIRDGVVRCANNGELSEGHRVQMQREDKLWYYGRCAKVFVEGREAMATVDFYDGETWTGPSKKLQRLEVDHPANGPKKIAEGCSEERGDLDQIWTD